MKNKTSRTYQAGAGREKTRITDFLGDKIIITVDDQIIIRKMVKSFLSHLGVSPLNMREADDGDTALGLINELKEKVGIILLDWNMPRVPGIDVLRTIRENTETRHIPVLMVTAETKEEQIVRAVEEGINNYLIKPFTASDLEEKMLNIFSPPPYVKLMNEAEKLIENGDNEKAITILEGVLRQKPESAGARMLLGRAHKNMGDLQNAKKNYQEAAEKNPHFIKALNALSGFLLEKGENEEALRVLAQADKISPMMPERKITMGGIYLEKGDTQKAFQAFEDAVKINFAKTEEIADICLEKGAAELATDFITRSIAYKSGKKKLTSEEIEGYIEKYNLAGISFRKRGEWQKAVQAYRAALDVAPDNPAIHFNMGKAYVEGNKNREAKVFYEKALTLNGKLAKPDPQVASAIEAELKRIQSA